MSGHLRSLTSALDECLALLLQPTCLVCGCSCGASALCGECRPFYPLGEPQCEACGAVLSQRLSKCGACTIRGKGPILRSRSLFWLEEETKRILHRVKYAGRFELLEHFRVPFEDHFEIFFPLDAAVVPVPIHYLRRFRRGFNQAELLAEWIGNLLGLSVMPRLLRKVRGTVPQAGLREKERAANLRGSFAISAKSEIPRAVLLVDDVMTTGSTLEACAKVLRRAGVEEVHAFTLFRTPLWGTGLAVSSGPLK